MVDGRNLYDPAVMAAQWIHLFQCWPRRRAAFAHASATEEWQTGRRHHREEAEYMRALVAGGAGFLGSHLCDALLAKAIASFASTICLLDAKKISRTSPRCRASNSSNDICQPFDFGQVDYVFNFASPASPVDYLEHGIETLQVGSLRHL